MNLKNFYLGLYMTNCYLLWNENKEGYFFDCGGKNLENIKKFILENKIDIKYLFLTHGHYDHTAGIIEFIKLFPKTKIVISKEETSFLKEYKYNLSEMIDGSRFSYNGEVEEVSNGDFIDSFEVISTPGHTIGSVCYYNKESNILISGDTMFRRSFGRTDLPTGNTNELFKSLKKLCDLLPEETIVYSAHTDKTTIKEEKQFLKSQGFFN